MTKESPHQSEIFGAEPPVPEGFLYREEFISPQEEVELLQAISHQSLREASYRQWTAKRRIISYGGRYDFSHQRLEPSDPVPRFLFDLRRKLASWAQLPESALSHATIAEYRSGTQLGWHRDVPDFEVVLGVSLAGTARMRFRPFPPREKINRSTAFKDLHPRSAYVIKDAARWQWQHAISPTKDLRYSITFRTLRTRSR